MSHFLKMQKHRSLGEGALMRVDITLDVNQDRCEPSRRVRFRSALSLSCSFFIAALIVPPISRGFCVLSHLLPSNIMPPNARFPMTFSMEEDEDDTIAVLGEEEEKEKQCLLQEVDAATATAAAQKAALAELLDSKADTDGLAALNSQNEDWTDVKHSERKKRDRILDDGVLIGLMEKSDAKGSQRLVLNLSILAATVYTIRQTTVSPFDDDDQSTKDRAFWDLYNFLVLIPLYFFYGFQFQCFAFAGQHEFLHRNAFKTKWINDLCLFCTGVVCFELGVHERVMHKQHHTFTNNIDKDPELTSYYTREKLENPGFRNLPTSRFSYFRMFWDILQTFKCRAGRIVFSAMGIAVDYSGTGWSLKEWSYDKDSGIMANLQRVALTQLCIYASVTYFMASHVDRGLERLVYWWIAPVLCGYPVVNYFRNLEHADCEVSKQPNALRNTRTVRSNIIIRILLWDTNFHAEHHCYPMVPFFNLHKINALMHDHVIHNDTSHFTLQNWAAVKPGGWIDQQTRDMAAYKKMKMAKAE
jgi:fatty acid desaturase